ncbi:MAG TPA: hypothetical protein PLF78_16010 [Caulobacter sp.]|nr:hypothetical protein [Caulobacter sp.]
MRDGQGGGYAVIVQPAREGWTWAITDLEARVAASGEAPDREGAWRNGMLAASTIDALRRQARRRF